MGALAVWGKPDPYVSLAKKMNEFLSSTLKIFSNINNVTQSSKKKRRRSSTTTTSTTIGESAKIESSSSTAAVVEEDVTVATAT